jgi:hypothetical protein
LFRVRYATPAVLFHKLFNKTVEILNRNHERQNFRPLPLLGAGSRSEFLCLLF